MAVRTLPETTPSVNSARHRRCPMCRAATPEQRVPLSGPHIHVCPAPTPDPAPVLAFFDGQLVGQGSTAAAAQQALDRHIAALIEDGLVTLPVALLGEDGLTRTLADFDYPAGVTHRTVSVGELEQAAALLQRQHPADLHERQLAAEVIAAHAEQRLQFTWHSGMLEVISWSSDGQVSAVNPLSGCATCTRPRHCIHAVLHALLAIRERGMTALIRHERAGGYLSTVIA